MITIVGISGRLIDQSGECVGTSRVGKDAAAMVLRLYHRFTPVGLADDITSILHRLGGRDGGLFKAIPDYRAAKQALGTGARERAGVPAVWRDVLLATIAYLYDAHQIDRFVVPDVRYAEEVDALRAFAGRLGGRFVHLEVVRRAPAWYEPDPHSSERPMDRMPDDSIPNDGTIHDLADTVDIVGEAILEGGYDHGPAAARAEVT